ncbi:MAG: hypothetical protein KQA41_00425 [Candidatus Aenigmarchaeota archaeon]|nr:hypothetical protein [Candidatus Aenigmarchaeota archaeon]
MKYHLALFLALFFIPNIYSQVTVGVSPPVLDLGEIDRGETKIAKFNVITSTQDTLIVRLEATRGKVDFFSPNNYLEYLSNYSEEDTKTWISFVSNPIDLEPVNLPGTNIKSSKEVTFILKVPENAEPGYHTAYIMLDPKTPKQSTKPIAIRTVFPLTVLFKVPGEAIRDGKIYETNFLGKDKDTSYFNTIFQNTGTVTILITSGEIRIYNNTEDYIASAYIPSTYVNPGETKNIRSLTSLALPEGSYKLQTIVYYSSGIAEKNSTIFVTKPSVSYEIKEKEKFPWWLIIIIILVMLLAYYWYKRD